jgi:hypothetical protein
MFGLQDELINHTCTETKGEKQDAISPENPKLTD